MYWIVALNFSRILYVRGELMDVVLSVPTCTVRTVLTPVSTSRSVTTYGLCIYTVLLLSTMFISHSNSVCTYPSLKQYNTKSYPYYNSDIEHGTVGIEHGTVGIEHGAVDTWRFLSCQSRTWRPWRTWRSWEDSEGIAADIRWILVGHLVGLIREEVSC